MKRLPVLMVVLTLAVGVTGCRSGNWFGRPSVGAVAPTATYSSPTAPAASYVGPVASPAACGPGCNSCGSTVPTLSDAQGYLPVQGN
jgi:hypothetical protein